MIADGIVAMEGNGPPNGAARLVGKIVLADDPVAAAARFADPIVSLPPYQFARNRYEDAAHSAGKLDTSRKNPSATMSWRSASPECVPGPLIIPPRSQPPVQRRDRSQLIVAGTPDVVEVLCQRAVTI